MLDPLFSLGAIAAAVSMGALIMSGRAQCRLTRIEVEERLRLYWEQLIGEDIPQEIKDKLREFK